MKHFWLICIACIICVIVIYSGVFVMHTMNTQYLNVWHYEITMCVMSAYMILGVIGAVWFVDDKWYD